MVIRPPRDLYSPEELGPDKFRLGKRVYARKDMELTSRRGGRLQCSHFLPAKGNEARPCVVYLHGNCSSRLEAFDALPVLLPLDVTVFSLDLSGSGRSDGEYISLGYHEDDFVEQDLRTALEYLRQQQNVTSIGLWGRSMGASTSILRAAEDNNIAACVLDSAFKELAETIWRDLKSVAEELVGKGRFPLPTFLTGWAFDMVRTEVSTRAGFDILELSPISRAPKAACPGFFGVASDDTFALHNAWGGHKHFRVFDGGSLKIARLLLEAGADKDKQDREGHTALMLAAESGHAEIVRLLLEAGAHKDLSEEDPDGDALTALVLAARNGHVEIARLLLEAGDNEDLPNPDHPTALVLAARNGHVEIVRVLLEAGAKDRRDGRGNTSLMLASENGDLEMARLLLEAGADKDLQDSWGNTAFMLAAKNGHVKVARLLLEAGADKDLRDSFGRTALALAARHGHAEMARLLLKAGADKDLQDCEGRTALVLAAENDLLLEARPYETRFLLAEACAEWKLQSERQWFLEEAADFLATELRDWGQAVRDLQQEMEGEPGAKRTPSRLDDPSPTARATPTLDFEPGDDLSECGVLPAPLDDACPPSKDAHKDDFLPTLASEAISSVEAGPPQGFRAAGLPQRVEELPSEAGTDHPNHAVGRVILPESIPKGLTVLEQLTYLGFDLRPAEWASRRSLTLEDVLAVLCSLSRGVEFKGLEYSVPRQLQTRAQDAVNLLSGQASLRPPECSPPAAFWLFFKNRDWALRQSGGLAGQAKTSLPMQVGFRCGQCQKEGCKHYAKGTCNRKNGRCRFCHCAEHCHVLPPPAQGCNKRHQARGKKADWEAAVTEAQIVRGRQQELQQFLASHGPPRTSTEHWELHGIKMQLNDCDEDLLRLEGARMNTPVTVSTVVDAGKGDINSPPPRRDSAELARFRKSAAAGA
eukprot:s763_g4.t1